MKKISEITLSDIRHHACIAAICPDGRSDIVWNAQRRMAQFCLPASEGKSSAEQLQVSVSNFSESALKPLYIKLRQLDPLFQINWCGTPHRISN